ncbi:MAG: GNAT family N-acetyltransferase [Deltaproteobacteria bacterium]|nr:GNAT family N-acetyltransferase [Deltaproteobacteria bacterium]
MRSPFAADLELARRFEHTDAWGGALTVPAIRSLRPDVGAEALEVAGGLATYCGRTSPLTRARGVAVGEPISAAEVDQLEAFFFDRGAGVAITVCPFTHLSLTDALCARGYRLAHWMQAFAMSLAGWTPPARPESRVELARVDDATRDAWAIAVDRGYSPNDEPSADALLIGRAVGLDASTASFLARLDGEVIAGASVRVHDGEAYLFGMSTIRAARGQGAQTALLRARLEHAREAGAERAWIVTSPGTPSERNAVRFGFQPLYSRCAMHRARPS